MRLLYKAYACEMIGEKNVLLPGFPVQSDKKRPQSGDKIEVELADGTRIQTTALGTQTLHLHESAKTRLRPAPATFHYAVQVPSYFSPPGIELGVKVYWDDSAANAAGGSNG